VRYFLFGLENFLEHSLFLLELQFLVLHLKLGQLN